MPATNGSIEIKTYQVGTNREANSANPFEGFLYMEPTASDRDRPTSGRSFFCEFGGSERSGYWLSDSDDRPVDRRFRASRRLRGYGQNLAERKACVFSALSENL
jgi:hypothetical protein